MQGCSSQLSAGMTARLQRAMAQSLPLLVLTGRLNTVLHTGNNVSLLIHTELCCFFYTYCSYCSVDCSQSLHPCPDFKYKNHNIMKKYSRLVCDRMPPQIQSRNFHGTKYSTVSRQRHYNKVNATGNDSNSDMKWKVHVKLQSGVSRCWAQHSAQCTPTFWRVNRYRPLNFTRPSDQLKNSSQGVSWNGFPQQLRGLWKGLYFRRWAQPLN